MDDVKLAQEIIDRLEEIGITKIDGSFGYKNRELPLRMISGVGIPDRIKNLAVSMRDIRREVVETIESTDLVMDEYGEQILEVMLSLFLKFYEDDEDDDGNRH